jgi:hypothetical protein
MNTGLAGDLITADPEQARALLAEARDNRRVLAALAYLQA